MSKMNTELHLYQQVLALYFREQHGLKVNRYVSRCNIITTQDHMSAGVANWKSQPSARRKCK